MLGARASLDGAGDVMLAATHAIECEPTVDDLAGTGAPYPAMAEESGAAPTAAPMGLLGRATGSLSG